MAATIFSIILGSLLTISSFSVFLLNITVLIVLFKSRLITSFSSGFYILAFANIFGNASFMFFYTFYLGPSSIIQDYLFENGKDSVNFKLIGYIIHGLWGQDLCIQAVVAINRALMIIYPNTSKYFTFKSTIILALFTYFLGFFAAFIGDFVLDCCPVYLYYKAYTHTFLGNKYNIAGSYLYIPLNTTCSIIASFCYISIFYHVKTTHKKAAKFITKSAQEKRKIQELKYAFQFALCTCGCIFTWISLRILMLLVPKADSPIYIIISFFQIIHSSSNSLVFLCFNNDVKHHFNKIFRKHSSPESIISISTAAKSQSQILNDS